MDPGKLGLADRESVDRVLQRLEDELEGANFFFPSEKGPTMRLNIRNLFSRAPLTDQDVRTLHGIIRTLAEGPKRKRPRG
ncbi:MAG: hypothetical protein ACU0DT_17405 [Albimonas sp.]|uniref:hypothetical protein n=1 Tax=Albimonas sp. TaxID=1872425 RepID=UPI004057779D